MAQDVIKSSLFGERLKQARKDAHLTIAAVAREIGVDPRTVAGWQSGRSRPPYERLGRLARLLGKSPLYFIDEEAA